MERLRQFMQEQKLSQAELARRLECTDELISMVLSGKRPLSNNLRWRFGTVFGFDIAQQVFDGPVVITEHHVATHPDAEVRA